MQDNPFPTPQPELPPTNPDTAVQTVQWFDSLPEPPQKPKKPLKLVLLIGAIILFAGAGVLFWFVSNQNERCLTTDDLKALTSLSEVDPVTSPSTYFFSYPVEFQPSTSSYSIDTEQTGPQVVTAISDFYKSHTASSIVLTISSDYFNSSDKSLADQRITTLRADLIAAGIPADHIKTVEPVQNDPENDTEQATVASVAITSDATCK